MTPRPRRRAGRVAELLLVASALLAGSGCSAAQQPSAATHEATPSSPAAATPSPTRRAHAHQPHRRTPLARPHSAAAQLATLVVAGRAPMTGYARDRFGQAWLDADRNGCDTRNDILRRDLRPFAVKPGTHGCVVLDGVLADPYTGARIDFVRAVSYSVDIDHVVALGDAWATGAWRFDIHERAALANDPLNLLAVDESANRRKGDADAASWLPPNRAYRCAYVARQVAVKAKYGLRVTPAEREAMRRVLAGCPGLAATPDPTRAPTRVDQEITDPGGGGASSAPRALTGGGGGAGGRAVYYQNCDAVRAAGAAPLHRGEPGYDSHLDRDGDGVACE